MAIVFDNAVGCDRFGNICTWVFNNGATDNGIMLVGGVTNQGGGMPTGCTYAGVPMTLIDSDGGNPFARWYYLLNPAAGINNVIMSYAGNGAISNIAATYSGVDPSGPIRAGSVANANGNSTVASVASVSQAGDVPVAFFGGRWGTCALSVPGTQNNRGTIDITAGDDCGSLMTDAEGGTLANLQAYRSTSNLWIIMTATLVPYVGLRGRAVKYFYDLWDPKPGVKDIQGKIVPPDQLRADAWIEMQGAKLPQSQIYDSFVEDPTKARVVEANSDGTLKASRSQFADVLIKRAAAGRG